MYIFVNIISELFHVVFALSFSFHCPHFVTQATNRAFLFFTIPFFCIQNYILSFSYASRFLSSVISLLEFQIFCNILVFSYLISPSHSSINSLTVCPSWLLVSHSA